MSNELTQKDTGFILWVLGLVYGQSDEMDERHQIYIEENHDRVLQRIGDIHESFGGDKIEEDDLKETVILGHVDKRQISKYLSFILRHNPAGIGLKLDDHGWADIGELIKKAKYHLTRELLEEIVRTNDKQRFKVEGNRIRASQGHSIDVDLGLVEKKPPEYLYHGAPERKMRLIWDEGLKKMDRNHVHLSIDIKTAKKVGQRHGGKTVILRVCTGLMYQNGYKFYLSDNNVWLTDKVLSRFLLLHDQVE